MAGKDALSRQIYERMDAEARGSLRGLRMAYSKETTALRSSLGLRSSWAAIIEYAERFALDLNKLGRPIPPTDKNGNKNPGVALSKRAQRNRSEMRDWQR